MSNTPEYVVRDFYAAGGPMADPDRLRDLLADSYTSHTSPPNSPPGPDQAIGLRLWLLSTFSDIDYELVKLVAQGDHVAVYTRMRGTHTGGGLGMAPTGKRFDVEQMHLIRVADGVIAEHWGVRDDAGMMRQLGLLFDGAGVVTS